MKKIIIPILVLICTQLYSVNVKVATYTNMWTPNLSSDASADGVTTDGWYYRNDLNSERLIYPAGLSVGTGQRIASTLGLGAPWQNTVIKFKADVPTTGNSFLVKIGSDGNWSASGKCIIMEVSKWGVQFTQNHDYSTSVVTWVWIASNDLAYPAAAGGFVNFELSIAANSVISLKMNGIDCPATYTPTADGINSLTVNNFFEVAPGSSNTGASSNVSTVFRFKTCEATRGAVANSYFPNATLATVSTTSVDVLSIGAQTATAVGSVTGYGSLFTATRGFCWNMAGAPTIADSKTAEYLPLGNGTLGSFTQTLTGLVGGQTYKVRSYITNIAGTSYGEEVSISMIGTSFSSSQKSTFSVYPTSGNGIFTVSNAKVGQAYRITNLTGQLVQSGVIKSENQQLNISNSSAGIYFISTKVNDKMCIERIVKN